MCSLVSERESENRSGNLVPLSMTAKRRILGAPRVSRLPSMPDFRNTRWFWPVSVLATGVAGAAVFLFRGCWHSKMSWPVRSQGYCYQVCMSCGIKRLFDEQEFRPFGPYRYDLNELIVWAKGQQQAEVERQRPAS